MSEASRLMKTGYEWCVQERTRPLNIATWVTNLNNPERSFFEEEIPYTEFLDRARMCDMKPNSTPRKTPAYLTYRMYGLVAYNLSDIQKGIQFGHAVVEYSEMVKREEDQLLFTQWDKFANTDKTFMVMSGGGTNNNPDTLGNIQKQMQLVEDAGIWYAPFYEPDLNNALSAFVFLVDERAFDKVTYPDFERSELMNDALNDKQYKEWVIKIGGEKNVFLRNWLPTLRFA